jgi:hypothetical protein
MNLRRITARTAVAGISTALAAGALVGVSTTSASAETASSTYTCSADSVGYKSDFTITVDGGLPVPQYWAGAPVPAGLLTINVSSPLSTDDATLLGSLGVTGAHSDDFALALGTANVPIPVDGNFGTPEGGGTTTWTATGSNLDFTTPKAGLTDVVLPQAFTMVTEQGDNDFLPLACVIKDGTQPSTLVADFPLAKQSSQTVAPANVKVKKGKAAKFAVKVSSTSLTGLPVPGKVVAKEGKKTLDAATLKSGKAALNLGKKLKLGKHKITVTYLGTPSVKGSSDTVVVKVVR